MKIVALGPFTLLYSSLYFLSLKGLNIGKIPKKHSIPVLAGEPAVTGEGEDYFLSLFGDTRKLVHSFHEKTWKHFSMILEEVGQSRSRYILYLNYLCLLLE